MRGTLKGGATLKRQSIGGQAVMEGVMMKNLDRNAVGVKSELK